MIQNNNKSCENSFFSHSLFFHFLYLFSYFVFSFFLLPFFLFFCSSFSIFLSLWTQVLVLCFLFWSNYCCAKLLEFFSFSTFCVFSFCFGCTCTKRALCFWLDESSENEAPKGLLVHCCSLMCFFFDGSPGFPRRRDWQWGTNSDWVVEKASSYYCAVNSLGDALQIGSGWWRKLPRTTVQSTP